MGTHIESDYIPYGPEWEKEMAKNTKAKIIEIAGKALREKQERINLLEKALSGGYNCGTHEECKDAFITALVLLDVHLKEIDRRTPADRPGYFSEPGWWVEMVALQRQAGRIREKYMQDNQLGT